MTKIDMNISRIRRISNNLLTAHDALSTYEKNKKSTADLKQDAYYLKQLIGDVLPDTKLVKRVYCLISDNCYGEIGEYTGYKDYHIGDVVSFNHGTKGLIVKKNGVYFVYGWYGSSLRDMELNTRINFKRILKHDEYNSKDLHVHSPVVIRNEFL